METDLIEQVQEVFRAVLNLPALTLDREMTANDVPGWDSLKHMELLIAVEKRFAVRFKTVEMSTLKNVGDLIDKLRSKIKR